MGGPTKDELIAELKSLGVDASANLTNAELAEMLDVAREEQAAEDYSVYPGLTVTLTLSEGDAARFNEQRARLSNFLKHVVQLDSERAEAGTDVPMLITRVHDDGSVSGNAFMPDGGTLFVKQAAPDQWRAIDAAE